MSKQDTEFSALIAAALVRAGMNRRTLANAVGWKYQTLCRRCSNPGKLSLDELRQLRRALRLTADELVEVI